MTSLLFSTLRKCWPVLMLIALVLLANLTCYRWGKLVERRIWQQAEMARQLQLEKNQLAQSEKTRAQEAVHALDIARIDQTEFARLKEIDDEKNRIIAGLRDSNQRLSVRIKSQSTASTCSPVTGTGVDHGSATAELSTEDAEFFIGEATRSDKIVIQLTACQQLLDADREAVNERR